MDPEAALAGAEREIAWIVEGSPHGSKRDAREYLAAYNGWRRGGGFEPTNGDARARAVSRFLKSGGKARSLVGNRAGSVGEWDVYVHYSAGPTGPFQTTRRKLAIPIPASWDNVDAAQEYAAKKLRVARSRVTVQPASGGSANRAKTSAMTEAQKKERAYWRRLGNEHAQEGREPIFAETPTGIDAISILARPTYISETAAGRAYLRGYGKRAYLRDSDNSNRARSPARSRLGKQALPKATETRVATLASLGVSYDPSLFYSVKGGKLLVRQRKAG